MGKLVTNATSWESGDFGFYLLHGYLYSSTGGFNIYNTIVHKSLSGAGGTYSLGTFGAVLSPLISTSSRISQFWWRNNPGVPFVSQYVIGGLRQFTIYIDNAVGTVNFFRGFTLLASSSAGAVNLNVANWFGIYLEAKNAGSCSFYANGVLILTFAGDTSEQATDDYDQVSIGGWTSFPAVSGYLDDWIITDDDSGGDLLPLPEQYCAVISPESVVSGNLTGVPTAGANRYQNINEFPVSTAEYNLAAAINDEDLYDYTAMPFTPDSISYVLVSAYTARDGAITQGQIHIVSGASDTYGTAEVLPASPTYGVIELGMELNPDGSVAWTEAAVNALQAGLKFS